LKNIIIVNYSSTTCEETVKLSISENICFIKNELQENITLIAVSKTRTISEMQEAYDAGMRDFGENKIQEISTKFDKFGKDVKWHLIGHLQTNKIKFIVGKAFLIHSLDSIKLLMELEKHYKAESKICNALIQINIGREESKTGLLLEELEALLCECEKCQNVKIKGLMAVIPNGTEEEDKKYFSQMKHIWDTLKMRNFNNIEMKYLSMGMTGDYKIAISEGSNMIRIGEGIFGKRIYNNK
jgi:PLP dependent protein